MRCAAFRAASIAGRKGEVTAEQLSNRTEWLARVVLVTPAAGTEHMA